MAKIEACRNQLRACFALALSLTACASEGEGTRMNGASDACTPPAQRACACEGRPNGITSCQVDGSWSVCACGAAPSGGSGGTGALPTGGTSAGAGGTSAGMGEAGAIASGGTGGAGGAGATGGSGGEGMPPAQVLVPPEDVAQCAGSAPPMANEEVTMLEIRTSDVVPGGFVSPEGTTYACFWVELDMPEKHHIIGWEGAVGTDRTVHHQQVSLGEKPFYLAQQGGLCGLPSVDYTWTGGNTPEWTPALAGFPIGGPENGGKARFLWQVHLEGATTYTGGFNAYVTKNLRKYDSANFEQGDVAGISIPANAAATHVATCTPDMTRMKITHPIYVYASMLHAHLAIRHIKAEHFRDGALINTFGDQMASGFAGFFDQRFLPHTPCIELLPGDEIVTTCEYMNPFPFEVTGGERTDQEMCTVFMQYFPRLPDNRSNFCGTIDSTGGFNP